MLLTLLRLQGYMDLLQQLSYVPLITVITSSLIGDLFIDWTSNISMVQERLSQTNIVTLETFAVFSFRGIARSYKCPIP